MAVTISTAESLTFTFKYSKLSNDRSTRLLELLPGAVSDKIKTHLIDHNINELPIYEALSYTWGDSKTLYAISIDGASFGTTENVYAFLKRYRHETEHRFLWIDQISINQSDVDEKTAQVKMMGDIYQRATRVVVWLGNSDDAKIAIELVKSLATCFVVIDPFLMFGPILTVGASVIAMPARLVGAVSLNALQTVIEAGWKVQKYFLGAIPWTTIARFMMPWTWIIPSISPARELENSHILAMLRLLRHSWFERVWIIQEIVLAKSVTVFYGNEEVSWDVLSYLLVALVTSLHGLPKWMSPLTDSQTHLIRCSLPNSMLHVCQMSEMRNIKKLGMVPPFQQLMRRFITCQATCRKDKIYALLQLSDEADLDKRKLTVWSRLPATINYDRSILDRDVFISTARNMLLRDCGSARLPLFILPFAGTGFGPTTIEGGLPSWVPDWCGRDAKGCKITTLAYHFGGEILSYHASGLASDLYHYNSHAVQEEIARAAMKLELGWLSLFGLPPGSTTSLHVSPGPETLPEAIKLQETLLLSTITHLTFTTLDVDFFDNEMALSTSSNEVKDLADMFEKAYKWQREAEDMMANHALDPYPVTPPICREEAYVRTVVGDRTPTARPAPEKFFLTDGKLFQSLEAIVHVRISGQELGSELEERIRSIWPDIWNGDKVSESGKLMMRIWIQKTWNLPFAIGVREICGGRKFAIIEGGRMAMVPPETKVGDQVRIIIGAQTPFIVRPVISQVTGTRESASLESYELVGECYVHGMMDGEAISDVNATSELLESILLL